MILNSQISTILILTIRSSHSKGKWAGWTKTIFTREYRSRAAAVTGERVSDAGLTQVDLAKKLAITQSLLSKIERGDRRIDVIELRAFCTAVGVGLLEFVRRLERELPGRR